MQIRVYFKISAPVVVACSGLLQLRNCCPVTHIQVYFKISVPSVVVDGWPKMSIGSQKQGSGDAVTALAGSWRVPGAPYRERTARAPGTIRE